MGKGGKGKERQGSGRGGLQKWLRRRLLWEDCKTASETTAPVVDRRRPTLR